MGHLLGAALFVVEPLTFALVVEQVFEVQRLFYGLLHRVEVFPVVHSNHRLLRAEGVDEVVVAVLHGLEVVGYDPFAVGVRTNVLTRRSAPNV